MKNSIDKTQKKSLMRKIFSLFIFSFLFSNCTDVVDVDVPSGQTRLVVEASLDWQKGTTGNEQQIILSLSTDFFAQPQFIAVTDANVQVTKLDDNSVFPFTHISDGRYTTNAFVPELNQEYRLDISYNGETYTATETLMPVTEITRVEQSVAGGFDDELIDVNFYFNDPADEENFYFFRFERLSDPFYRELEVDDDEFTNGNEIEEFLEIEDDDEEGEFPLQAGDEIQLSLFGVSEQYYNFIGLLIEQAENDGNPFATVPAEVRGNIINTTNTENYAYGYFRVTEVDVETYVVQ